MQREMTLKKISILLIIFTIVIKINGERVKLPKPLETFLGSLEKYKNKQTDIVYLLDDSGSIGADKFPEVKKFSKIIAQHLSVSAKHNRIAVLTFSTDTTKYVDYIQYPDGNMCTLGKKIDSIIYSAGWTHTDKAMREADNILARGTSPIKIVILLTDGESNDGHSPVAVAKSMRSKGIIIFAVGVANVNQKEIDDVASSKEHTYILSNFSHIETINKYLVDDTKDDHVVKEDDSLCDSNCDANAQCYCGTSTGRYECMCNAGYFGASGKSGQCSKCPKGTYKETSVNKNCTACPRYSTTEYEGSTSLGNCKCEAGYDKIGQSCMPVTCATLTAPNGGILIPNKCNNTYGSKCSFHCREGYCPFSCALYDVVNGNKYHTLLPQRTCLETRKWSNDEFHCEKKKCVALNSPLNGHYTCSEHDFSHGTTCTFSCEKGYELTGSLSRICEFGVWSGQDVICKAKTCDQLKTNSILHVKPSKCSTETRPYRSVCTYFCTDGYSLIRKGKEEEKSDGVLVCGADGQWSGKPNKFFCKDTEPPKITCPASVKVNTDANKGFAHVILEEPSAADNVAIKNIILIEPKNYDKNFVFPINKTKVTYEAIDESNLTNSCSFIVEIIDIEPPQVISCPSDILIYNDSADAIPVTWHGPIFEDNSGKVSYTSDRRSGDKFGWGTSVVSFTASDLSNNTVSCSFTVTIKPYECPYYKPPENGLLLCDKWNYGKVCSIFCHEDFQLAGGPDMAGPYICSSKGKKKEWKHFNRRINVKMPWPDCSRKQTPVSFNVSAGISYTVDSCSDQILKQMKEKFYNLIKNISVLCPRHKQNLCTPENVHVTCNPIEIIQRKRRSSRNNHMYHRLATDNNRNLNRIVREAVKQKLSISFDIVVFPKDTDQSIHLKQKNELKSSDKIDDAISLSLKTLEDNTSLQVKDIYNLPSVPNPSTNYEITAICSIGQIHVNNSCIFCPHGTYKDEVSETCIDCPQASYQDEEGKLNCKPCPVGYTTYQVKSKFRSECRGPCQPGTYSKTAFEPCFACPFNTYQDRSTRKECLKCPQGLYTWRVGANSSSDCIAPCKPGTFSNTGYEPCTLCDAGFFQDKEMQKYCSACPFGKSTAKKGAKAITECKEIDLCNDLRPCHPHSTCIQHDKEYQCICPEGLLGKNCEINLDDCANNPCLNNGSCIDLIGNFSCLCSEGWSGYQCEINIDDCASNPCFNSGECIDKLNAYECRCIPGFTGERCERNVYECENNPCLNNGDCFDMLNGYRCCCPDGYYGINCENKSDINICDTVTCENGGTCFSDGETFTCKCHIGFEGNFCEYNIDDCLEFFCDNKGVCVDQINNATCICSPKFTGLHCETALTPEFVLKFPTPVTSNYAMMENKYLLPAITVAFHMRTSYKVPTSRATPVSYSYKSQDDVVDNALTFLDTNNFVLFIHGHAIHTEYSANKDADWHHYVVTWERLHGNWTFFVDGNVIDKGNIAEGKYMYPGVFILGQEQDDIGGQFSTLEAFVGDITEFNVWDYALNNKEIQRISSTCGVVGNVIPWYKISESVYGGVIVSSDVEKCQGFCPQNSCDCFYANETAEHSCKFHVEKCVDEKTCSNGQPCVSSGLVSFCNCSKGFEGRRCEYDVDECIRENGGCSHTCINDIGTYHCECPDDMFLSDDKKTCKDTSYCLKGSQIYVDGEIWMDSCQTCTCIQGIIKCEEIVCSETICHEEESETFFSGECCPKCVAWSFCLISLNKTIMNFDMSSYEIEGECLYTAVEDCISGRFKVQMKASEKSTNETNLVIYQDCSKLVISSNGSLLLDESFVPVPYIAEEFTMEDLNSIITIKTKSHLLVQWDLKNEVIIGVPTSDVNKMCGVCSKIEQFNVYGNRKFTLSERYSSDENQCVIIPEGFEETPTNGCFSTYSCADIYHHLLNTLLYFFISFKLMHSY